MSQDYQLVVRTLGPVSNLTTGVQSYSEFRSYLQANYLDQGYEIFDISFLGAKSELGTDVNTFSYHLVKEVVETPSKAKTDK
jgi:hypothetical protein